MFILSDVSFVKRIHPSISISQFLGIRTSSSKLARKLGVDRGKDPSKKLYIYVTSRNFLLFLKVSFFSKKGRGKEKFLSLCSIARNERKNSVRPNSFHAS